MHGPRRSAGRHLALAVALLVVLAACAAPANTVAAPAGAHLAGFWTGLWHGIICPFTLVVSWFSDSVGVYDVQNDGGWYDFGFVLGASMIFGGGPGSGAARRRRRSSQG
jgi:hypothetical protein